MEVLITKLISLLAVPPGLFFSFILLGALVRLRFYRSGQILFYTGLISLFLISIPLVSSNLVEMTQANTPLTEELTQTAPAKAIVILGGGRYPAAPEYQNNDTVSRHALERCRYGSYLQRKLKLPILVSGGSVYGEQAPEAVLMKNVIENSFVGVTHWVEDQSRTTYENALYTYKMIGNDSKTNIILVTHALHMARATEAFEHAGFTVTPAPLGFHTPDNRPFYVRLIPNIHSASTSAQVFHEWFGRLWYKLRYY